MNAADIILIAVIAVILFFAVRRVIKNKGSCNCGCAECSGCAARSKRSEVRGKKSPQQ
ncbi:MAG: FeoB-associated Cys-rich membrane protein [Ruminococcus sp.]|nr:FeoB-associated Cys-rich membrane protein [Ruminococcus sp.]